MGLAIGASGIVVTENGRMVDAQVERIAAIIKDYDPNLELAWVPPENRSSDGTSKEFPFAVVYHNPATGQTEPVMLLRENEIDHRILKDLWRNDNAVGTSALDEIEAEEAARKAVELKEEMDFREEQQELATWMIKARPGATINGVTLE